jgi:predicted nucleotidyltransferase
MIALPREVTDAVAAHPYPLLFATISGAHLYGFPSPDSDWDIRGVHILPPREVLGLDRGPETIESMVDEPVELDLVTHDVEKFFRLMLRRNGYVLEQLFSPLIVRTSPEHEELVHLGRGCITRHHSQHYLGFFESQWRLFERGTPRRVKPLLYVFRVLLTGIHLMRSGEVEANLQHLNAIFRLPYVDTLIARKLSGPEQQTIDDSDLELFRAEALRLRELLVLESERTSLHEVPTSRPQIHDLLLRLRGA